MTGLGIAVILLPVVISLVACIPVLPVPIGNPEKSRVDPEMAGVWFDVLEENLWLIEPYDRRTYLTTDCRVVTLVALLSTTTTRAR